MTPQEEASIELRKWQSSDGGRAERFLYELGNIADDLTDAAKTKEGCKLLRADYPRFLAAMRKLDDLKFQVSPIFTQAAE